VTTTHELENTEIFGPRVADVVAALERLEAIQWFGDVGRPSHVFHVLSASTEDFARGLSRSGPLPPMKPVIKRSYAEVRARSTGADPTIARALAEDTRSRAGCPRAEGARLASFVAVSRVLRPLAPRIFRGALLDFATDQDAPAAIDARGGRVPGVAERAQIAHTASRTLPELLPSIILSACAESATDGSGIWMPLRSVRQRLTDDLRLGCSADLSRNHLACATAAVELAWEATFNILNETIYGVSCHIASIVRRPRGAFDLWAPWVAALAMGLPIFGLHVPGTLGLFQMRMPC